MLKGLVNNMLGEELNSVRFKDRLLRKIEEVTSSCRQAKKMTEAMLDDQGFVAPLATNVKRETRKAGDAGSEGEDRCRNVFVVTYSKRAQWAS